LNKILRLFAFQSRWSNTTFSYNPRVTQFSRWRATTFIIVEDGSKLKVEVIRFELLM